VRLPGNQSEPDSSEEEGWSAHFWLEGGGGGAEHVASIGRNAKIRRCEELKKKKRNRKKE
jgi:hypothetical protein